MIDPHKKPGVYLSVAKKAALLAGKYLLKSEGSKRKIRSERGRDIKINADIESQKIILDYLRKKSDFSILSEENGFEPRRDTRYMWVIDPLDGSFNYARGIPISCVSIGIWEGDKPLAGVVYDFNKNELFAGLSQKGAWLNGKPVSVSNTVKKKKAVLCTGFPVNADFSRSGIATFVKDAGSYKKIRLLGSAALSVAYVACGRADVYKENGIMLWDVAGAIPVLLGAGGKLAIKKKAKRYLYDVRVTNGYA